jgi:hypothetical protein
LEDLDLSEEGIGFGLPVIKLGQQTVFPGSRKMSVEEINGLCSINADYEMNLTINMARKGKVINNGWFSLAWENLSQIHREYPRLRKSLSISSRILKGMMALQETFCRVPTLGFIRASYLIGGSNIDIDIRFPRIDGCTELIVLNEQGANWFDTYMDSDGLNLRGDRIGSWNRVQANCASLVNSADALAFILKKVEGAEMFRGRELAAGRLAWAGLAYVLPPDTEKFAYSIDLRST